MRITSRQLRQIIREALAAEDRQFIQGIIDDLQALEQATAEVEGLSDDAPADERKKKLEALTTAVRGILSYEGEDLAIGETPEELEMLTAAGFDPTSIKQLLGYAVSVHTKAEEAQKKSAAPKPATPNRTPGVEQGKIPDWVRRDPNVNYEPWYAEHEKKGGNIYNPLAPWKSEKGSVVYDPEAPQKVKK